MDFTQLGTAVGAIGGAVVALVSGVWLGIQKVQRQRAETKASVAEDARDRSVADSQKIVYDMLLARVSAVELELRDMKLYTRKLELHISRLEKIMREKGLEIPDLVL